MLPSPSDKFLSWARDILGEPGIDVNTAQSKVLRNILLSSPAHADIDSLWLQFLTARGYTSGTIGDRYFRFVRDNSLYEEAIYNGDTNIPLTSGIESIWKEADEATFTRASIATSVGLDGTRTQVSSNEPRFEKNYGVLIESSRTNSFLNSDTPASHTSPSLGTGNYILWCEGTGTVEVAANTATGTGFGTASEGTPVSFNISVAGTVDFTVTGSVTIAQCEDGTFETSYIPTGGAAVTRAADSLSYPTSGNLLTNNMSGVLTFTPIATVSALSFLINTFDADANNYFAIYHNASSFIVRKIILGVNYSATYALAASKNTEYKVGWRISSTTGVDIWVNATKGTNDPNTTNVTVNTNFYVGSQKGVSGLINSGIKDIQIWQSELTDAELQRLTQ